jgi:hypothetical protein
MGKGKAGLPLVLSVSLLASQAGAAGISLTRDEFRMYRYYANAMEHPEVKAMKPEKRKPAIAKDGRFKLAELEAAIAKGEAEADLKGRCEAAVRGALGAGLLAGRVGQVEADLSSPQAVLYVQWFNEDLSQVEEEASFAAAEAVRACPVASTLSVWAQAKGQPSARVFQGLVSAERAERFKVADVADFADTRYLRSFEDVKHAGRGDDLSGASGTPNTGTGGSGAGGTHK